MSRQHCENDDVKRETVYCYPRNIDCCCTWSEHAVEEGLMLSLESQRVFPICFCCRPICSSRETLRFSRNKIPCSPRDQSLSVKYLCDTYLRQLHCSFRGSCRNVQITHKFKWVCVKISAEHKSNQPLGDRRQNDGEHHWWSYSKRILNKSAQFLYCFRIAFTF